MQCPEDRPSVFGGGSLCCKYMSRSLDCPNGNPGTELRIDDDAICCSNLDYEPCLTPDGLPSINCISKAWKRMGG